MAMSLTLVERAAPDKQSITWPTARKETTIGRLFAVTTGLALVVVSCGGAAEPVEESASTTSPPSTVASPTTTVPPTTTTPPPSSTTTTMMAAQPLEDVLGVTASGSGWHVEPGTYSGAIGDVTVTIDISQPVTYFESSGRLDFGPETIVDSTVPDWVSLNQFVGVIPPEKAGEHAPHEVVVPDYTVDLPDDLGPYLESIPHLVVEEAESIQGIGFTAKSWNVTVDPSQGDTFSCFLGSCVSVLVSESGGVFVFGSDASARVWQFDGDGESIYGYLQSRPGSFEDTVAVAEMLIAGLAIESS